MEDTNREEEGVEIPYERINPETLHNMLSDYVSREWSELADAGFSLEDKIRQVTTQLQDGRARVLFDLKTSTWNIVPADDISRERHKHDA